MSKKRKKRGADDPMTGEEERLMSCMPSACGLPLVEKLSIGLEQRKPLRGQQRAPVVTLRAKLCCQGNCGRSCSGWTAVMRTSDEEGKEKSLEDITKALAAKIQEDHLEHHASAIAAAYAGA